MRLIRLASNGESVADITNNFKEGILLKKGGKIALQSLSLNYPFVVKQPNVNSELEFSFKFSTSGATTSKSGQYINYTDTTHFLNTLNRTFNSVLSLSTYSTSRKAEFYIYQSKSTQKLYIKYYINTSDTNMIADQTGGISSGPNFVKAASTPGTLDFAIANKYINSGMARFITTLNSPAAPNGLIIGLCQGVSTSSQLTASDIYHAVIVKSGNYYDYKFDTDTGEAYTTGDKIHTLIQNGNIEIFLEKAANPGVLIDLIITKNMTNDFRLYGFYASEEPFSVSSGEYSPSPFIGVDPTTSNLIDLSELDEHADTTFYYTAGDVGGSPPSGFPPLTTIQMTTATAKYLGFTTDRLTGQSNTNSWSSRGFNILQALVPENLAVEMPSLMINSYDNRSKGRRSIVHYSANPSPNQKSLNQYIYNANELVFLDLNQIDDVYLNQFRFRILDNNMQPILIGDECYLVLVIS